MEYKAPITAEVAEKASTSQPIHAWGLPCSSTKCSKPNRPALWMTPDISALTLAGAAAGAAAALGELDPHPAGQLDLVEVGVKVVAGLVFDARVRGQLAGRQQVFGALAEHAPERDELVIEIVDGLDLRLWLGEQHRQPAGERLDVVQMLRECGDDPVGDPLLAAVVGHGGLHRVTHLITRSSSRSISASRIPIKHRP